MAEDRNRDRDRDRDDDNMDDKGDGDGRRERGGRGGGMKRSFNRRKVCRFCADTGYPIDYKDPGTLKYFVTDRGKIVPRRISGNCAKHQRALALAVKRARMIALIPFSVTGR